MKKILSSLNQLAEIFEANNEPMIASEIHDVFMRVAKKSTQPNLDKKESVLRDLNIITASLENFGDFETAESIHNVFMKLADKFKPEYQVEFPMNLDDALNNYDSSNYEVDFEGDWEETDPIEEFRDDIGDTYLHSPAAIDDNHIIFENPENEHVEVMNMVPKHHIDSLHENDD